MKKKYVSGQLARACWKGDNIEQRKPSSNLKPPRQWGLPGSNEPTKEDFCNVFIDHLYRVECEICWPILSARLGWDYVKSLKWFDARELSVRKKWCVNSNESSHHLTLSNSWWSGVPQLLRCVVILHRARKHDFKQLLIIRGASTSQICGHTSSCKKTWL